MSQIRTLIGRGIYDSDDIAHLTGASPRAVSRWAGSREHGGGLLFPVDRRLFNFWDLITARLVAMLLARGASIASIRDARDYLAGEVDSLWPLAHYAGVQRLASVGGNVYWAEGDRWFDATLGGQAPFSVVVEPLLQRLAFDHEGLASSWSPQPGVVLRPTVQAGSPCVEGTRVPTALLADLAEQGEDPLDLADDYELTPELVRQAIAYEAGLAQAA